MTWQFRTIPIKGRKLSAYGLFSSYSDRFAALLEAPKGEGRQFLVSAQGYWEMLDSDDFANHEAFFADWKASVQPPVASSPAIRCLVYAAYEAGGLSESLPASKSRPEGPLLALFYPQSSICLDPESGTAHLAAETESALDEIETLLAQFTEASPAEVEVTCAKADATSDVSYKQAVERVKAYIAAGDVFQANIARFWSMPLDSQQLGGLYASLRRVNPAPYSCLVRIPDTNGTFTLISASPERLFRIDPQGNIDTRPIAGTRKRGDGEADDSLKAELLLSEKERAEHIMLVDLERNDLGRVCEPGSVCVDECMSVERYSTVQHIVSNVSGRLAAGCDVVDAFRAMFPGGTITGCPKIRCMEIIHELEPCARGPYTGGLGYIAWDGSADMNILIRTFWHQGGILHWAAGAGIVADSDPEMELAETGHKAEGLIRAFGRCSLPEGEGRA